MPKVIHLLPLLGEAFLLFIAWSGMVGWKQKMGAVLMGMKPISIVSGFFSLGDSGIAVWLGAAIWC